MEFYRFLDSLPFLRRLPENMLSSFSSATPILSGFVCRWTIADRVIPFQDTTACESTSDYSFDIHVVKEVEDRTLEYPALIFTFDEHSYFVNHTMIGVINLPAFSSGGPSAVISWPLNLNQLWILKNLEDTQNHSSQCRMLRTAIVNMNNTLLPGLASYFLDWSCETIGLPSREDLKLTQRALECITAGKNMIKAMNNVVVSEYSDETVCMAFLLADPALSGLDLVNSGSTTKTGQILSRSYLKVRAVNAEYTRALLRAPEVEEAEQLSYDEISKSEERIQRCLDSMYPILRVRNIAIRGETLGETSRSTAEKQMFADDNESQKAIKRRRVDDSMHNLCNQGLDDPVESRLRHEITGLIHRIENAATVFGLPREDFMIADQKVK